MKKVYQFAIIFILFLGSARSQVSMSGCTLSGGMSVYNACNNGQGCMAGCNLAATYSGFGNMCNGTSFTGNCIGGEQSVSTAFVVPAGCTANVTAEFKVRGGSCSSSGMDAGDMLGINGAGIAGINLGTCGNMAAVAGVVATGCTGSSNASVDCTYSQTGGTIMIWGSANRSDEIITYTITLTGSCGPSCNGVLPITLTEFIAEPTESSMVLKWSVAIETGLKYYQVEKSTDGVNFIPFQIVNSISGSAGNSNLTYFATDFDPAKGINYYKLTSVEISNTQTSKIISAAFRFNYGAGFSVNTSGDMVNIIFSQDQPLPRVILVKDMCGRLVKVLNCNGEKVVSFPKTSLPTGLYLAGDEDMPSVFKKLVID